jgi:hypothetical protein
MQGWSPFRLSKGPLFSCQSSGKEAKMVPFSANKWSPFRLTNTIKVEPQLRKLTIAWDT